MCVCMQVYADVLTGTSILCILTYLLPCLSSAKGHNRMSTVNTRKCQTCSILRITLPFRETNSDEVFVIESFALTQLSTKNPYCYDYILLMT